MKKKMHSTALDLDVYTPLCDVYPILQKRRKNDQLRSAVSQFFGNKKLSHLSEYPKAVLTRSISSPNVELRRFLECAKRTKLQPIIFEYHDKMVARNLSKYFLCKLFFYRENSIIPYVTVDASKIVDFNKDEGKNMSSINTIWGENLIEFHHRILFKEYPSLKGRVFDFTNWFNDVRNISSYYYSHFLSLFLIDGVLFENFLSDKEENDFFQKKVLPSFRNIEKIFGVRPLICRLLPKETEDANFWQSYPERIKRQIPIAKLHKKCYHGKIWNLISSKIYNTAKKLLIKFLGY